MYHIIFSLNLRILKGYVLWNKLLAETGEQGSQYTFKSYLTSKNFKCDRSRCFSVSDTGIPWQRKSVRLPVGTFFLFFLLFTVLLSNEGMQIDHSTNNSPRANPRKFLLGLSPFQDFLHLDRNKGGTSKA